MLAKRSSPVADRDADGALRRRRHEMFGIEIGGDLVRLAQPVEPGHRQHGGVGHAIGELLQPRIDIAAERHDPQIRPQPQHLRRAPDRGGAEFCPLGQVIDAP